MTDRSERQRKRYAEDPEFRARVLASNTHWRRCNKEKINAQKRLQWATDAVLRERGLAGQRAWRKRNKQEINAKQRLKWATMDPAARQRAIDLIHGARLKRLYGITLEQYNALLVEQKGRCAICRKKPKPKRRLHVDHCHRRQVVRGLLCGKCNQALGLLNDDPRVVQPVAAYLTSALKRKPRRASKR